MFQKGADTLVLAGSLTLRATPRSMFRAVRVDPQMTRMGINPPPPSYESSTTARPREPASGFAQQKKSPASQQT